MGTLSYELQDQIAVLTIQSPPANALSSKLLRDLSVKLDAIEHENTAKAIVIKGEGKFFSAGADIKEFTSFQNSSDYQSLSEEGQNLFDRMESFSIPIIAAIHGAALGGGLELAMACHIRIVTESAKLGLPELNLGIIPGFAGTQRLPQYVGGPKAYEMILTGDPISGTEAQAFGLANRVVADDNLVEEAMNLAKRIAAKSKPTINQVMKLVPYAKTTQFAEGVKEEARAFGEIFGSEDAKEGVRAFIEKRKPNFQDK
ncbi:short chain enoyl-CoA hydratase [Oceanobacillus limi]|uniref:Short chain enoyl-CoA hydratase n=1 Tax=Oceanobacillus limi TaxID=930131 RepID=A0A1I0EEP0_9BACI|nr:enoyl-CoA hydratase [Oceanobacillus limi]SET43696.1 short chain enoyl-CoA hydratase [Oceanobacillus limi]